MLPPPQVVFLFTMLSHRSVFENTVSLLEEVRGTTCSHIPPLLPQAPLPPCLLHVQVLAVRIDTFSLALVPDLYGLVSKFSARHLAHFCRVLSLVLFEPEVRARDRVLHPLIAPF
jgi:hypothetical protein